MKKLILLILIVIPIISLVNAAVPSLGTFKQGEDIELIQTCTSGTSFCESCNISSVKYPNSTIIVSDTEMTNRGTDFNYTLSGTYTVSARAIGEYNVNGYCSDSSSIKNWAYTFQVNPSGFINTTGFYVIIALFSIGLISIGFIVRDAWITMFGTFGLYFLGIYTLLNGIVGIRDLTTTWAISLIMLGVAGYISIKTGIEMVQEYL